MRQYLHDITREMAKGFREVDIKFCREGEEEARFCSKYFYFYILMKNISDSEDESGYCSSSVSPPQSPPLCLGRPDQFSKFACGAGAGLSLNKKSQEAAGVFPPDRRDQWRDKVSVLFHTGQQGPCRADCLHL